jgi:hypothetical protein
MRQASFCASGKSLSAALIATASIVCAKRMQIVDLSHNSVIRMMRGQMAFAPPVQPLTIDAVWSDQMADDTIPETRAFVTRAEAVAAGLTRYFTGKPCHKGHICECKIGDSGCVECRRERETRRAIEQRERIRTRKAKYYVKKRKRALAVAAIYREINREKINAKERAKRKSVQGRLNQRISSWIHRTIGSQKGGQSWTLLVGYSGVELRAHLERQFKKGMTWRDRSKWHIDHIIPLSSFNFTSPDDPEFKAAWALTNLRPLWAADNIAKGAKREFLL